MRMVSRWPMVSLVAMLTLSGCGGDSPHPAVPDSPRANGTAPDLLENPLFEESLLATVGEAALGGAMLSIDAANLTASVAEMRTAQATDDSFHLSLQNFLTARHFSIDSIRETPTELVVEYTVTHPFPAPADLALPPNGSTNRADLGITGRVVFLIDVPSPTGNVFFTDVIANTEALAGVAGYLQPRGLVPQSEPLVANAFPFHLLVDEARGASGNRVGISNGGFPQGNYNVIAQGWQAANIGATRKNWTGFDYLHQGQSASNTLNIRKSALSGGPLAIPMVVVAKYTDPRGGADPVTKRSNRLPRDPSDVNNFVYRMPYGALDVGRANYVGESGGLLLDDETSESTVRMTVRDWDARTTESGSPNLADELDPHLVEQGAAGFPTVRADIPGITTAAVNLVLTDNDSPIGPGGDPNPESGVSNDQLYYEAAVTNAAGALGGQVPGQKRGMFRITDISNGQDRSAYEFQLAPDLTPLAGNRMSLEIFQSFDVLLGGAGNLPPTANVVLTAGTNPTIPTGGTLTVRALSENDPEGDPISYTVVWQCTDPCPTPDDGPTDPPTPAPVDIFTSPALVNPGPGPLAQIARVRYYDPLRIATPIVVDLPYTISDSTCGVATQTYNFNTGLAGWQVGSNFGLPNEDLDGWGAFGQLCNQDDVEAASGGGLSGSYLGVSADAPPAPACGFLEDYGADANYNIVSPILTVPLLCGGNQVGVTFNYVIIGGSTGSLRVHTSIDNGCSWVAQGTPINASGTAQSVNNRVINFTGVDSGDTLLVRFQYVDTGDPFFGDTFAGPWIDEVRITADSAGAWTPGVLPTVYFGDSFEAASGWATFGLAQTDAAIAEGGACGNAGPWGGWQRCLADSGEVAGTAMTVGGDGGDCSFDGSPDDLAHSSDYNIVSPAFSLVGATAGATIGLDEIVGCDQWPWNTKIYMAANPPNGDPTAWGTPVVDFTHEELEAIGSTELSAPVPAALLGQTGVRIRVQVTTPPASPEPDICTGSEGYTLCSAFAIGFDNVRVGEPRCQ